MKAIWITAALTMAASIAHAAPCDTVIHGESVAIAVPGHPFAAIPSRDGCTLFVSLTGDGGQTGVAVLTNTGGTFHLARTYALRGEPTGLALTTDGKQLVVANGDTVAVIDAERLAAGLPDPSIALIPDDRGAEAIYATITPDGQTLFVADERRARLSVIDLPTRKVLGHIALGQAPVGLAMSADGSRLYATSQTTPDRLGLPRTCPPENGGAGGVHPEGALAAIDVARARTDPDHALLAFVAARCNPVRVALSPDGASLFVTARGSDMLLRFPVATLGRRDATVEAIKVGRSPVGVAVSGDSLQVWVSNSDRFAGPNGAGSLSLVRVAPGQPMAVALTRTAGGFPRDLRFLPDGKTLVSAEFDASRIVLTAPVAP